MDSILEKTLDRIMSWANFDEGLRPKQKFRSLLSNCSVLFFVLLLSMIETVTFVTFTAHGNCGNGTVD